jgi:hypothetical protein
MINAPRFTSAFPSGFVTVFALKDHISDTPIFAGVTIVAVGPQFPPVLYRKPMGSRWHSTVLNLDAATWRA